MGMDAMAYLVYGVVIERDELTDEDYCESLEAIYDEYPDFTYTSCGHPDASERFVLYDEGWAYCVEWDEVYSLQPGDLEAAVDVIKLCTAAKKLGIKNPQPGWHLVAYYG